MSMFYELHQRLDKMEKRIEWLESQLSDRSRLRVGSTCRNGHEILDDSDRRWLRTKQCWTCRECAREASARWRRNKGIPKRSRKAA